MPKIIFAIVAFLYTITCSAQQKKIVVTVYNLKGAVSFKGKILKEKDTIHTDNLRNFELNISFAQKSVDEYLQYFTSESKAIQTIKRYPQAMVTLGSQGRGDIKYNESNIYIASIAEERRKVLDNWIKIREYFQGNVTYWIWTADTLDIMINNKPVDFSIKYNIGGKTVVRKQQPFNGTRYILSINSLFAPGDYSFYISEKAEDLTLIFEQNNKSELVIHNFKIFEAAAEIRRLKKLGFTEQDVSGYFFNTLLTTLFDINNAYHKSLKQRIGQYFKKAD